MNLYSKIDVAKLWHILLYECDISWIKDGSGVLMANPQNARVPDFFKRHCRQALLELDELTGYRALNLMINRLPAGCHVQKHTDIVLGNPIRYHLPLVTNVKHCYFWDEKNGIQSFQLGEWHQVDYTIPHSIGNFGTEERVHLIVDVIDKGKNLGCKIRSQDE